MKGFIEIKSVKNNTFIIRISNIGAIREKREYSPDEIDAFPELAGISVCTIIYNLCGSPLCYTAETIKSVVNKIEKSQY